MGWKNIADIEASFRHIEQSLDVMLEQVRPSLVNKGIVLRDDSNRSGAGGHDFAAFIWSFHFEKREDYGSEIKRANVRLWYREQLMEEDPQTIEVSSVAEIFQTGKQSRVCEVKKMIYPIEQFLTMRMDQVIIELLASAEQILAKY
jgi:hypothetical protein